MRPTLLCDRGTRELKRSSLSLALTGLFAAAALALSFLESLLPPLPVPAVRLGLANVAVTAAIATLGVWSGGCVAVLKTLFVVFTRGATAGIMSACGTLPAVLSMIALMPLVKRETLSYIGMSITSAALHTAGQLVCATCLLSTAVTVFAPPMLLISIVSGTVTGFILNSTIPRLPKPLNGKDE